MKYPTFGLFLRTHCGFCFLGLAKASNNSESAGITGSSFLDLMALTGILLFIMFIYWRVRYGSKNKRKDGK